MCFLTSLQSFQFVNPVSSSTDYKCFCTHTHSYIYRSVYSYIYRSVYSYIYRSVYSYIYRSVYSYIYRSVYSYIYRSVVEGPVLLFLTGPFKYNPERTLKKNFLEKLKNPSELNSHEAN